MRARAILFPVLALFVAMPLSAQDHSAHGGDHAAMHGPPPTEGIRAELIQDIHQLESKYLALAEAMSGRFDWRPAEGVRSLGEVLGHVAGANFMLPGMAGAPGHDNPEWARSLESMTDETELLEALEHSFRHAREAIGAVPEDGLDGATEFFGQPATNRQVLTLLVSHMHEHLGQAIAYARVNGITPPWSGGQ